MFNVYSLPFPNSTNSRNCFSVLLIVTIIPKIDKEIKRAIKRNKNGNFLTRWSTEIIIIGYMCTGNDKYQWKTEKKEKAATATKKSV